MEELSIRMTNTVKKIRVNEAGEYISYDARDQEFIRGLLCLVRDFEALKPGYEEMVEEINGMPHDTTEEQLARAEKAVEFNMRVCGSIGERVDLLFRDNVCRKVFGDITPSVGAFAEFFSQLRKVILLATESEKVKKYTDKYR